VRNSTLDNCAHAIKVVCKKKILIAAAVTGSISPLFVGLDAFANGRIYRSPFRSMRRSNIELCQRGPVLFGHRIGNVGNDRNPWHWFLWSNSNLSSIDFNDKAGSGCVPPNWEIVVYLNSDYSGPRQTISARYARSPIYFNFQEGSGFNNKVSSVRVYRFDSSGRAYFCEDQFSGCATAD